jgi:hypothetical protein
MTSYMYHGNGADDLASTRMSWFLEDSVAQSTLKPIGTRVPRETMYDAYSSGQGIVVPSKQVIDETLIARINVIGDKIDELEQMLPPTAEATHSITENLTNIMLLRFLINGAFFFFNNHSL